MEDRGSDAVVGRELGDSCVGSFGDDVAGDEAGGVGAVGLVEGVDGGLKLFAWHKRGHTPGAKAHFVGGL